MIKHWQLMGSILSDCQIFTFLYFITCQLRMSIVQYMDFELTACGLNYQCSDRWTTTSP